MDFFVDNLKDIPGIFFILQVAMKRNFIRRVKGTDMRHFQMSGRCFRGLGRWSVNE